MWSVLKRLGLGLTLILLTSAVLREPWCAPPDLLAKAAVVIDEQGRHERAEISGAAGRNC